MADMRLSDAERDEAIEALSEHVRTGRLDIDEYGTRSAQVTAARTRRDLVPLFEDLPEPHPSVLAPPEPSAPRASPAATGSRAPERRFSPGLVPIAAIVALVLFLAVTRGIWFAFLIPVVLALIFGMRSR